MSLRNKLKQREEKAQAARTASQANDLPEGVGRYVRLGAELKEGRTFAILADPDDFYAYFVHADGDFATRSTFIKTHTCLHNPRALGDDVDKYEKPNSEVCPTCAAMKFPRKQRTLHAIVPVFDIEYKTYRFLDLKEFHVNNIVDAYDKLEKAARKFNKEYTLVGDAVVIKKTSDGKSYTLESADTEGIEEALEEAKKFIGVPFNYADEVNFREVDDVRSLVESADGERFDKSTLGGGEPGDISDDDLPF